MYSLVLYFKKRPHLLILGLILLIGLFFRTYKIVERFEFAHDGDLYSWIVKDIVVNHHFRLIGQLTSAPGIFIGPLFYYLLIPFFIITKMDPVGAVIPITIIAILTIISFYYVFSELFNKHAGLIVAFLQSTLIANINYDRWIVPTNPVKLWTIWYFYSIFMIARGNFSVLPILAFLISLIWHIHIALLPTLIAIPLAFIASRKLPTLKNVILSFAVLLITSLPFLAFEVRHGFSQIRSLTHNFNMSFNTEKQISSSKIYSLEHNKSLDNSNLSTDSQLLIIDLNPLSTDQGNSVEVHVYSKNPKFNTLKIKFGCGRPDRYEIGSADAKFVWSTQDCIKKDQLVEASARVSVDPFWRKILSSFSIVVEKLTKNISDLFLTPLFVAKPLQLLFTLIILASSIFIINKKWGISFRESIPLIGWIVGLLLFFTFSSITISEYYLTNAEIIFMTIVTFIVYKVYTNSLGKYLVFILGGLILVNSYYFIVNVNYYNKGYSEKKAVVEYIRKDAKMKQFPCIGINYITTNGENTGFRYFFYLKKIHLVHPSLNVPVYNIVIPDELSNEVKQKFGHIGIIPPTYIPPKEIIEKSCQTPDTNLTDPMLGYTD